MSSLLKGLFLEVSKKERKKFLGVVNYQGLLYLEDLLKVGLGVKDRAKAGKEPRRGRPFVGWMQNNYLYLCFLTRKGGSMRKVVNLRLCSKSACPDYEFEEYSYVFYDFRRNALRVYSLPALDESFYKVCGYCKNLEHLDEMKVHGV